MAQQVLLKIDKMRLLVVDMWVFRNTSLVIFVTLRRNENKDAQEE